MRLHHRKPGWLTTSATWPPSSQARTCASASGATQKRTTRKNLQAQEPSGIAASDLRAVCGGERNVLHPLHRRGIQHERIVDGKEDAVGAQLHHRAEERRGGKVAARGDTEMLAEGIAEGRAAVALA